MKLNNKPITEDDVKGIVNELLGESDEAVETFTQSLKEVELIQLGILPKKTAREFLDEVKGKSLKELLNESLNKEDSNGNN